MQLNQNIEALARNKEKQALHLLEKEKNPETINQAIQYLNQAVNLWKTADGCTDNTAMALLEIGDLFYELENLKQAEQFYLKAFRLYESMHSATTGPQSYNEQYLLILSRIRECGRNIGL